ncbi:MAG: diguanylate cyclase [Acholeplasmataceae bacterium]|jgi:predicted signal transduction protein with EAL and GGDEF domain|nr:diguanylate cyclase [Acholeplasmataceae bacterium]
MAYFLLETTSTGKDYLTKVYNRQSFEDYTNQMIEKKKNFVLLIFDLDRFKEINDQHDHLIGDLVLFEFANSLTKIFSKLVWLPDLVEMSLLFSMRIVTNVTSKTQLKN